MTTMKFELTDAPGYLRIYSEIANASINQALHYAQRGEFELAQARLDAADSALTEMTIRSNGVSGFVESSESISQRIYQARAQIGVAA